MRVLQRTRPFNICVIGTGQMGRIFLPIICSHPLAVPHTVVARSFDDSKIQKIKNENSIPDFYGTKFVETRQLKDHLEKNHAEIDGFVGLATSSAHFDLLKLLAPYGKPILMEKPLTETLEQSKQALKILNQHSTRVSVGFQRRYDPSYRALLKKVRQENAVGKVQSIFTRFGDYFGPPLEFLKEGGDLLMDVSCHDLDFIRCLQGAKPVRIRAITSRVQPQYIEAGVDDSAYVFCQFKDGSVSVSEIRRVSKHGYDIRCEVSGPEGVVEVQNIPRTSLITSHGPQRNQAIDEYPLYPDRFQTAYANQFEELVEMMSDEARQPAITHQEILDVHEMVEAAGVSVREGRAVDL